MENEKFSLHSFFWKEAPVTLEEASKRYGIAIERLKWYERKGFLQYQKGESGLGSIRDKERGKLQTCSFT